MFVASSHSYVMPLVKCSSRTIKSKDTLNQCCFQCNASSNMNQWHFFSCPAKFPIKISCFFSLEMQLSWSAYSPGASRPTLMLLNFIATNEEEALWVSFSDGNGTGAGALFLIFLKKKLLAHGTLLHFRWTAPKGPMNWIIHVGDWCHPFYDGVDCRYGCHHEVCSFLVWPFAKAPACWSCSCANVLALHW